MINHISPSPSATQPDQDCRCRIFRLFQLLKSRSRSQEAIFLDHTINYQSSKKPYRHTNKLTNTSCTRFSCLPQPVDADFVADLLFVQLSRSAFRSDHLASGVGQTNRGEHTDRERRNFFNKHTAKGVQYQWSPKRQTTVRNRKIKI